MPYFRSRSITLAHDANMSLMSERSAGVHDPRTLASRYKSASKDVLEGKIDEATYNVRIDAREDYAARPKARPDEQGRVPMICPASGDSPTIICPLKQISQRVSEAKKRKLDEVNPK